MPSAISLSHPADRRVILAAVCALDLVILLLLGLIDPLATLFGLIGVVFLASTAASPIGLVTVVVMTSCIASIPNIDGAIIRYGKLGLIVVFIWLTAVRFLIEKKSLVTELRSFEKVWLVFIVWAAVTAVTAIRTIESLPTMVHFALLFTVYFFAAETVSTAKRFRFILYVALAANTLVAAYSATLLIGGPIYRIAGFLGNANSLGILGFVILSMMIVAVSVSRNRWEKVLFASGIIMSIFYLGFSWSRASWLAAIGFVGVFIWLERRKLFKFLTVAGALLIVCVLLYEPFYKTFYELGRVGSAATRREVFWQHGVKKALERPVLGYGFSLLRSDVRGQDRLADIQEVAVFREATDLFYAHNGLVTILIGTGIPGLVMLILAYIYLFRRHIRWRQRAPNRRRKKVHSAIIALLLGSILNSMFETGPLLGDESYSLYMWVFLGLAVAIEQHDIDI